MKSYLNSEHKKSTRKINIAYFVYGKDSTIFSVINTKSVTYSVDDATCSESAVDAYSQRIRSLFAVAPCVVLPGRELGLGTYNYVNVRVQGLNNDSQQS